MTDIREEKKTWLTPWTRKFERAKQAIDEFFISRANAKSRLRFAVLLVVISVFGGFIINYLRHEVGYIEYKVQPVEHLESDAFSVQLWPARRPYSNTMSASNLQEVQAAMLNLMPADAPCFHAAALGETVDIMIISVNDTRFIIRDMVNVEFIGAAKGSYYHSFVDQSKIAFEFLHPELRLHFISVIVVGSSSSARQQRELVRSPFLVDSKNLAHCIQRFYKPK